MGDLYASTGTDLAIESSTLPEPRNSESVPLSVAVAMQAVSMAGMRSCGMRVTRTISLSSGMRTVPPTTNFTSG